jgi:co-chaperonin GroES (HSP10)
MKVVNLKAEPTNRSGIYPSANRVLVKPDEIEKQVTGGRIELPDSVLARYEQGQASGVLVAVGPDAFSHVTERVYQVHSNKERQLIEERVRGYSEPFAAVGDRIAFAKYSGLRVKGEDGQKYIILNDEDITCRISAQVEFTDLDTRKGVGVQG